MHYANGRAAVIGEPVVGYTYNRKGVQTGILMSITVDSETCNAIIGIVEKYPIDNVTYAQCDYLMRDNKGGMEGNLSLYKMVYDYTDLGKLIHAEDAFHAVIPAMPLSPQT